MSAESEFKKHEAECLECTGEIEEQHFCSLGKKLLNALIIEDPSQAQYWVLERDAIILGGIPNKSKVVNDWQQGKTVASIAFVNQAESVLAGFPLDEQKRLQKEIELLKNGQKVLFEWISISEFLNGPIL